MISAVVLTKNEEENIERCVNSLLWCDEIIVVDDYSNDKTIRHAEFISASKILNQVQDDKGKIVIYQKKLEGDFAEQRNFGLEKVSGEWVFFVDADEVVSEDLKKEILSICYPEFISGSKGMLKQVQHDTKVSVQDDINGFYLKRKDYFLGKWLKHGETGDIKFIRLARKEGGMWQGRIHEIWKINGQIGELKNPILHYPHGSVAEFLRDINIYTDLVAQYWKEEGRKIGSLEIIVYPIGKFVYNYIFKLGFLDGSQGFIMAAMMSFHSFLARGKYWLIKHNDKNS